MKKLFTATVLYSAVFLLAACSGKGPGDADKLTKAKANFERACSSCHSLDIALSRNKTLEGWQKTVHAMRVKGAAISEQEGEGIAEYLFSMRPLK